MAEQQSQYSSWDTKWHLLVADAWEDDALRQRLINDPKAVLKERGMAMPDDMQVKVIEDSPTSCTLVLPAKPAESELSEEQLQGVSGGACFIPCIPCMPPPPPCGRFCGPPCRPCVGPPCIGPPCGGPPCGGPPCGGPPCGGPPCRP